MQRSGNGSSERIRDLSAIFAKFHYLISSICLQASLKEPFTFPWQRLWFLKSLLPAEKKKNEHHRQICDQEETIAIND